MATIWAFILAHKLGAAYVAAVLIERLPPPDANSGKLYAYFYSVIQVFAANLKRSQDAVKSQGSPKV